MTWKRIVFKPVDTLFFRDGRPYHSGETTQFDVKSLFPPSPTTLVGAVRAYYSRALGWDEYQEKNWNDEIKSKLGDGEHLNGLKFLGPFLLDNNDTNHFEPLFPAPYHLVGKPPDDANKDKPANLQLLQPSEKLRCDLDSAQDVYLPTMQKAHEEALKPLDSWWLTKSGLETILENKVPDRDSFKHRSTLWEVESRIGIERDEASRTTKEGAMYSPHYIRLCKNVQLGLLAFGLPDLDDAADGSRMTPVGGESRACYLDIVQDEPSRVLLKMPDLPTVNQSIQYMVITLTPMSLPADNVPLPNNSFLNFPGTLISACLPRPQRWGGWDSVKKTPLPLKSYIPPGSVFYFQAEPSEKSAIQQLHETTIGERQAWGFGLIAIGNWKQGEET